MAKQSRDPSYERLARALFLVHPDKPADGPTPIGAAFGGSPQLANNWPQRGVPIERAVEAQRRWGINAVWVLHGEGEKIASILPPPPPTEGSANGIPIVVQSPRARALRRAVDIANSRGWQCEITRTLDRHQVSLIDDLSDVAVFALRDRMEYFEDCVQNACDPDDAPPAR